MTVEREGEEKGAEKRKHAVDVDGEPPRKRSKAAAGALEVDEIIDPGDTRAWLAQHVSRMQIDLPPRGTVRPLANWPTCY